MSLPKSILFATSNAGKLREVRQMLEPMGVAVDGLDSLGDKVAEPVEDQDTFEGNALIKARYYAALAGRPCLADDSGLCVDALNGDPGVHSAYYGGGEGDRPTRDAANNAKLIASLAGVPAEKRTARFVCVMILADEKMTWVQVRGEVTGRILDAPRGENGFGYDPLFEVDGKGQTAAELPPEEKNAISHRGRAVKQFLEALGELA